MLASEISIGLKLKVEVADEMAMVSFISDEVASKLIASDVIMKFDERRIWPPEVESLMGDTLKVRQKWDWVSEISVKKMRTESVVNNLKLAK